MTNSMQLFAAKLLNLNSQLFPYHAGPWRRAAAKPQDGLEGKGKVAEVIEVVKVAEGVWRRRNYIAPPYET
jgi:hypothetical protein